MFLKALELPHEAIAVLEDCGPKLPVHGMLSPISAHFTFAYSPMARFCKCYIIPALNLLPSLQLAINYAFILTPLASLHRCVSNLLPSLQLAINYASILTPLASLHRCVSNFPPCSWQLKSVLLFLIHSS